MLKTIVSPTPAERTISDYPEFRKPVHATAIIAGTSIVEERAVTTLTLTHVAELCRFRRTFARPKTRSKSRHLSTINTSVQYRRYPNRKIPETFKPGDDSIVVILPVAFIYVKLEICSDIF